jgi:hypothetical protein
MKEWLRESIIRNGQSEAHVTRQVNFDTMPSKFIKEFHNTARNYKAIKEKLPMARLKPVLKELKTRVKSEGKDFDTYPESIIE